MDPHYRRGTRPSSAGSRRWGSHAPGTGPSSKMGSSAQRDRSYPSSQAQSQSSHGTAHAHGLPARPSTAGSRRPMSASSSLSSSNVGIGGGHSFGYSSSVDSDQTQSNANPIHKRPMTAQSRMSHGHKHAVHGVGGHKPAIGQDFALVGSSVVLESTGSGSSSSVSTPTSSGVGMPTAISASSTSNPRVTAPSSSSFSHIQQQRQIGVRNPSMKMSGFGGNGPVKPVRSHGSTSQSSQGYTNLHNQSQSKPMPDTIDADSYAPGNSNNNNNATSRGSIQLREDEHGFVAPAMLSHRNSGMKGSQSSQNRGNHSPSQSQKGKIPSHNPLASVNTNTNVGDLGDGEREGESEGAMSEMNDREGEGERGKGKETSSSINVDVELPVGPGGVSGSGFPSTSPIRSSVVGTSPTTRPKPKPSHVFSFEGEGEGEGDGDETNNLNNEGEGDDHNCDISTTAAATPSDSQSDFLSLRGDAQNRTQAQAHAHAQLVTDVMNSLNQYDVVKLQLGGGSGGGGSGKSKGKSKERDKDKDREVRARQSHSSAGAPSHSSTGSSSSTTELIDREIVINVTDEARSVSRVFKCPRSKLLEGMNYFGRFLSGSSADADVDISVHCDIHVFSWLMKYVQGILTSPLDDTSVVSILISSSFLGMPSLVRKCLRYIHQHANSVLKLPIDLRCMDDDIVSQLAMLFTTPEIEALNDRNDKIKSRLFQKKVEEKTGDDSLLRKCRSCGCVLSVEAEGWSLCPRPVEAIIDRHGDVSAPHVLDSAFDCRAWALAKKEKQGCGWRKLAWEIWGLLHHLPCSVCNVVFPVSEYGWCLYHPGSSLLAHSDGGARYTCCGGRVANFSNPSIRFGCEGRNHTVPIDIDTDVTQNGDGESKRNRVMRSGVSGKKIKHRRKQKQSKHKKASKKSRRKKSASSSSFSSSTPSHSNSSYSSHIRSTSRDSDADGDADADLEYDSYDEGDGDDVILDDSVILSILKKHSALIMQPFTPLNDPSDIGLSVDVTTTVNFSIDHSKGTSVHRLGSGKNGGSRGDGDEEEDEIDDVDEVEIGALVDKYGNAVLAKAKFQPGKLSKSLSRSQSGTGIGIGGGGGTMAQTSSLGLLGRDLGLGLGRTHNQSILSQSVEREARNAARATRRTRAILRSQSAQRRKQSSSGAGQDNSDTNVNMNSTSSSSSHHLSSALRPPAGASSVSTSNISSSAPSTNLNGNSSIRGSSFSFVVADSGRPQTPKKKKKKKKKRVLSGSGSSSSSGYIDGRDIRRGDRDRDDLARSQPPLSPRAQRDFFDALRAEEDTRLGSMLVSELIQRRHIGERDRDTEKDRDRDEHHVGQSAAGSSGTSMNSSSSGGTVSRAQLKLRSLMTQPWRWASKSDRRSGSVPVMR